MIKNILLKILMTCDSYIARNPDSKQKRFFFFNKNRFSLQILFKLLKIGGGGGGVEVSRLKLQLF